MTTRLHIKIALKKILCSSMLWFSILVIFTGCNYSSDKSAKNQNLPKLEFVKGDTLKNSIGINLIYIPKGEFSMGSYETVQEVINTAGGQKEWYLREHPNHLISITKGFFIGQTEITQKEYREVMKKNPSVYKGDFLPVENVTWYDAWEFCKKLSKIEKRNYRLPTEAEWEYACRAGTKTRFHFGNNYSKVYQYMNYCDKSNTGGYWWQDTINDDTFDRTSPVKSFPSNAFGLFDMHGNVWEYCSDWFQPDYYQKSLITDPLGATSGEYRILRGGSWHDGVAYCRAAFRNRNPPYYTCDDNGFRIVLEIED